MLYLTTGANGTGKTLLTLRDVKEMADKEARPVCYNGRFQMNDAGPLRSWKRIDAKDWQAEPDGTIFVIDECHNDFPIRPASAPVPEYVRMLAEHRARGFDFFLITQHPQNIDAFVRRLIGNPGWHRHLKRVMGAEIVSVIKWDAVNPHCERPGSGESGQTQMVPYPKEVYSWYKSAELHTGKRKIPRQVFVLAGAALLVPALGWYGLHKVRDNALAQAPKTATQAGGTAAAPAVHVITPQEYIASRAARVDGLPWTAPVYDKVTEPVTAPIPAACALNQHTGDCRCYSQQATRLEVPRDVCSQIAKGGLFIDWQDRTRGASEPVARPTAAVPARPAPMAAAPAVAASGAPAAKQLYFGPAEVAEAAPVDPEDERAGRMFGGMRNRAGERWSW